MWNPQEFLHFLLVIAMSDGYRGKCNSPMDHLTRRPFIPTGNILFSGPNWRSYVSASLKCVPKMEEPSYGLAPEHFMFETETSGNSRGVLIGSLKYYKWTDSSSIFCCPALSSWPGRSHSPGTAWTTESTREIHSSRFWARPIFFCITP